MFPIPFRTALAAGTGVIVLLMPTVASADDDRGDRERRAERGTSAPLVIGHRGASGYRPEHTLAAYALAARMGADYIEPDLVPTKDGVLVARHENAIKETTDVETKPEFADRKKTKTVDGIVFADNWFTEDFTLAELKTLRAKERIPQNRPRNTIFNGRYSVPTFQEVLELRERLSRELGREIGVYPETKHPTYFDGIGLSLEEPLIRALRRNGLDRRRAPVFVQSFETENLKQLNRRLKVPIVQLLSASGSTFDPVPVTYASLSSAAGLQAISDYADGVGPAKNQIVPRDLAGTSLAPTTLVADAKAAGLLVHPYTFRVENPFLPRELRTAPLDAPPATDVAALAAYNAQGGNLFGELAQFFALGVDGVFTDNPDIGVEARDDFIGQPRDR